MGVWIHYNKSFKGGVVLSPCEIHLKSYFFFWGYVLVPLSFGLVLKQIQVSVWCLKIPWKTHEESIQISTIHHNSPLIHDGRVPKMGVPQIIQLFGYPHLWKPPYVDSIEKTKLTNNRYLEHGNPSSPIFLLTHMNPYQPILTHIKPYYNLNPFDRNFHEINHPFWCIFIYRNHWKPPYYPLISRSCFVWSSAPFAS